jgi:uncharacterized protein (TIGR02594 family)
MNEPLVMRALSLYGLREVSGAVDNPTILEMAKDCGFTDYRHDETPWCSLYLNWVALKAGYERSKSLAARSWLTTGQPIMAPVVGDVAVLWRGSKDGPYGHVGLYMASFNGLLWLLGGNEGNMAQIQGYSPTQLLGYRRLQLLTK